MKLKKVTKSFVLSELHIAYHIIGAVAIIATIFFFFYANDTTGHLSRIVRQEQVLSRQLIETKVTLDKTVRELEKVKTEDQRVRNDKLETEIKNIQETYQKAVTTYEQLLKLKELAAKTADLDKNYSYALVQLSDRDYASASATLAKLQTDIKKKEAEIAASFNIPANVPTTNTPPGSGYSRQVVASDIGSFMVDIVAADLGGTRVIVDTASDGNCSNDCPVMALHEYAGRSGAYAGINGPYFCPASYPSCADKKNSFDTLLMNKSKTYFNSDNNIYSTVPAVIFSDGGVRWVSRSLEWGRDTGVDAVIANQPLLLLNGEITFGGDDEIKRASKGPRSFIASKGNTAYTGIVYNANVAEVARVLKAMGIENALNLDSGGSTALWNGRYLAGPGRSTPFGILFVRK